MNILSKPVTSICDNCSFFSRCNFFHCQGCEVCARLHLNYRLRCIVLVNLLELFIQNMLVMRTNYDIFIKKSFGDVQRLVMATHSDLTLREQMEMTLLIILQLYHMNVVSPVPFHADTDRIRAQVKEAERLAREAASLGYFTEPDAPQHAFSFEILRTFAYKFLGGVVVEKKERIAKFAKFTIWVLIEVFCL